LRKIHRELLTDAAKSHLYENYMIKDMPIDCHMRRVNSTSANLFDSDLDVKAYPELFPDGQNGMDARCNQVN